MPGLGERLSSVAIPPGIVLPYYARADLSYIDVRADADTTSWAQFETIGQDLEIPIMFSMHVKTSAVVADRLLYIQVLTPDGKSLGNIFAPQSQPASKDVLYVWQIGTSSGNGAITAGGGIGLYDGGFSMPMFPILLTPGSIFTYAMLNRQIGDLNGLQTLTRIKIPTGPQLVARTASTIPTPVLV